MRSEDGRIELSRRNRSIWLNPKSRQKLSEAVRRLWQNPEYREKWRKRNELRWKSSEFRKRMSEFAKEAWKNPEFRRKRSEETKKLWQNLEFREKCITKKLEALQIKPNGLEKAVCDLLQSYFLNEWRYIGNGKMSIAGFIPDFVHKEEKWIIEVNGNYWHNLPGVKEKDERKRKAYEKYGYRVLEVWEREFRSNPIGVVNKIMEYFYQES
jgi:very-short-patch-repair endonuclease